MDWQTVKTIIIIGVIILATGVLFFTSLNQQANEVDEDNITKNEETVKEITEKAKGPVIRKEETVAEIVSPLDVPDKRIKLKRFGDYITPESSPVSPERFRGYHTGVDMEVFPEELNSAVEVKAACAGKILEKKWVNGYGGVVVTECEIKDEAVTVLYGHLNLASISVKVGDILSVGDIIGSLGADLSQETDRERKHLHFSIYRGKTVNLRGYVNTESELSNWLDPCEYICQP